MLLTLSQPTHNNFGTRVAHDFKPPASVSRFSPRTMNDPIRQNQLPASMTPTMSTHHRGLPPPAGMALPDPGRAPALAPPPPPPQLPANLNAPLASLPDPPRFTGTGTDSDPMRNWLATKAEEEKRKQEEERTRQEGYKLQQRQIEHAMLQDSLHGHIPPSMVPMIFAGIGGANLANHSLEMLQQWQQSLMQSQAQMQQQQQQQKLDTPPELRREARTINQAHGPYMAHPQAPPPAVPPPQALTMQQAPQGPPPPPPSAPPMTGHQATFSAYPPHGQPSPPQSRMPQQFGRAAAHSALPRLTTGDMQIHPPPTASNSTHPLHQTQTISQQEQPTSSPSIYFHHWVPPTSQADKANAPQTPVTGPGTAHLSEGDFSQSPRKRKNQGPHQPVPPPAGPVSAQTSPHFSNQASSGKRPIAGVHGRSGSRSSKDGDGSSGRPIPGRRDSGAPHHVSQVDFVVNVAGGPPRPDDRRQHEQHSRQTTSSRVTPASYPSPHRQQSQQHYSHTAPSSPKREHR